MDLMTLKKKLDGYRVANGSIKNVPPELLLELRQTWEHFTGDQEAFRSELGVRTGTLRKLLIESKKLNHILASAGVMELSPAGIGAVETTEEGGAVVHQNSVNPAQREERGQSGHSLELAYDQGTKVIRFPNVDALIEFLRKSA